MDKHSIVIPVYNSENSLSLLVTELESILPSFSMAYEVILVNDGSRDASWEVIVRLAAQYPWITGINMMRNYGQHNALLCGIRTARYPITITMDDDLQHPPAEIPKLLAKLAEGHDMVYGTAPKLPHAVWRNLLSRLTKSFLAATTGIPTIRYMDAYRAFRTDVRDAFAHYASPHLQLDALLTW